MSDFALPTNPTPGEFDPPEDEHNLFDPDLEVDEEELDDDGEFEDELDEQEAEAAAIPEVIPDLPALLFYDSLTHGKRRFYVHSLKGKPEWSYTKDGAFTFDNLDHLKLAGRHCRDYGYKNVDFESVK